MTSPCPMGDAAEQEENGPNEEVAKQAAATAAAASAATAAAVVVPLLHALTCPDNAARNQAEQAFNGLKEGRPEDLVYGLLEVSAGSSPPVFVARAERVAQWKVCWIVLSAFVPARSHTHTRAILQGHSNNWSPPHAAGMFRCFAR